MSEIITISNINLTPSFNTFGAELISLKKNDFKKLQTRKITLLHRPTGRKFSVDFTGSDKLLIWTMAGAKFLCIKPWNGLSDYDITKKAGIMVLNAQETIKKSHNITL